MLSIFTSINRAINHARLDAENDRLRRVQEYRLPNLKKGVTEAAVRRRERKRGAPGKASEAPELQQPATTNNEGNNSMAGKYIPPQRQNRVSVQNETTGPVKPEDELYSLNEIKSHLGKTVGRAGTLNASDANPDKLAFILVLGNQRIRFHSHNEIFCKSDLHLLPPWPKLPPTGHLNTSSESSTTAAAAATLNPSPDNAFLLFEQQDRFQNRAPLKCLGHHHITSITRLDPQSAALVSMLTEKFGLKDSNGRDVEKNIDAQRWQEELAVRWAIVRLEKVEMLRNEDPMRGCRREEKKSVNELMRELRAGGGGGGGAVEGGEGSGRASARNNSARGWSARTGDGGGRVDRFQRRGEGGGGSSSLEESFDGVGPDEVIGGGGNKGAASDTWSLISTGPIDKTYTVVHETKDEET